MVGGHSEEAYDRATQSLGGRLKGAIVRPSDDSYDEERAVWNGMIDRHPAFIARCVDADDVAACIRFAREKNVPIAVRGGRHSVAGHAVCEGGLVIDLSHIREVQVDSTRLFVHAGGGATIGDVDAATQRYGLAVPFGVVSATGIAGLTLGGGYGWLRSKFGTSSDNLVGAEMVTADGNVVHTHEGAHPDLLWGLRGGGGNFGVVTRFEFRAHSVGPEVMFVFSFKDGRGEKMTRALRAYRDLCAAEPDEVSSLAACGVVPPDEHFPAELRGVPFVLFGAMYAGPPEQGRRALQGLCDHGDTLIDGSGVMPYLVAQRMFDAEYPDGRRYYWKSLSLLRLDDDVIDGIVDHARRQPSPYSTTDVWPMRGAVARGSAEVSPLHGRHAPFMINPEANWLDPNDDAANLSWVRRFVDAMQPFSDGSRYLNFAGFQEEGERMIRQAYGGQYERLRALKRKYDPDNLFRLNQNIVP